MFKLVIQDDEGKTTVVPLIRDEITIGRKEGNTIRLTERNVSRRHARILRNNGEVQIEDLGSYNGIRVNNARIAERVSLRVSDQVQIGDYKLYLKAEGVEQVDDARTMPIERVDGLPTDVMPAQVATAPIVAQAPNRSQVAVADTDPQGRPVASAAQVAALTATPAYGKLVIVSSNFAGKEYELTRPQMIIGRTDENDIVVNHRSISRNHAKITRDPETGRYTISDLQSSNGVRVNGQDYGKVELRRGDTVDLGHVRLRFVEPGEDFIFSRDAVIADVPETGGKKGLLVALVLGVLLLCGVGVFFLLKSKTEATASNGGSQTGSTNAGGNPVATNVHPENNAGETGSAEPQVAPAPADAAQAAVQPAADDGSLECKQLAMDKKWTEARDCTDRIKDKTVATQLKKEYTEELQNEIHDRDVTAAVNKHDLAAAKKALRDIKDTSVYRSPAEKKVDQLEEAGASSYKDLASQMKMKGKCADDKLINEANEKGGARARAAMAAIKCEKAAVADRGEKKHEPTPVVSPPPPANCDPDAPKDKGMELIAAGQHAAALGKFEESLRCKRDSYVMQLAFMESCSSANSSKAKYYYKLLSPAQQTKFSQICIRQHPPVCYQDPCTP